MWRDHGTATVTMMGENQIQVHCFGDPIDTTFVLDYYENNEGDEHFGGFNMQDGTFTYSFQMEDETSLYYLTFQGVKQ